MNKQSIRRRLLGLLLMLPMFFGLTGCFEQSTVVKVDKDGSGVVHYRNYSNSGFGDGLFGNSGGAGDNEENNANDEDDETLKAKLEVMATAMGDGVVLQSFRKGKNQAGWDGHEAIFCISGYQPSADQH